eukprot:scaffold20444_cov71-Phaeocystis_antarctica.AAC.3
MRATNLRSLRSELFEPNDSTVPSERVVMAGAHLWCRSPAVSVSCRPVTSLLVGGAPRKHHRKPRRSPRGSRREAATAADRPVRTAWLQHASAGGAAPPRQSSHGLRPLDGADQPADACGW